MSNISRLVVLCVLAMAVWFAVVTLAVTLAPRSCHGQEMVELFRLELSLDEWLYRKDSLIADCHELRGVLFVTERNTGRVTLVCIRLIKQGDRA